ncbi:cardiolipin synthase [uncultured Pseudoflavonifractor sp.]|uniref:cardiolipin synthase n=1 Tax=uncultured Pseudoflavonifractor sp. TaxID=1221379 RepID=UPI00260000CC|nr:cardiolipin synthase [uncultured Pseudoflavonifractor sp.]
MVEFANYFVYFYLFCVVVSILVVLWIVNARTDPGYKIAWIVPILLAPVFGGLVYLLSGGNQLSARMRRKMEGMDRRLTEVLSGDCKADILEEKYGADAVNQARYLERFAHCPLYTNTEAKYYPLGDDVFADMLEALRGAERYIFLEYFIIGRGLFWNSILEILEEKARAGVDVRVIYDDVGCLYTLPKNYPRELERKGIRCQVFNRFIPVLSVRLNNRDHRKFCIVDGHTAFTGGINLADEYINRRQRYGHWKDSAIRVSGEGAWSMTVMFLTMWEYICGGEEDYNSYRPAALPPVPAERNPGYVQPYTDSPLDGEPVGETVYLNLISKARRYVYITTPYLIVSDSVNTALCNAAKSGVDVRIMTPHIPDKKIIFEVTRAHYEPLLEAGVRIYEYTPGFVHGKNFAVDDCYATVGSINMDYRSMFLHFEDGVWLCGAPAVLDVKKDFLDTLPVCQEITLARCRERSVLRRLLRAVLRVFAPLM